MILDVHGIKVYGIEVDSETRCNHYRTNVDIIAIRFACCDRFYPCFECHSETSDHAAIAWPKRRFGEPVVLCGACGHLLSVLEYLAAEHVCPQCHSNFNPGCLNHRRLYFEE